MTESEKKKDAPKQQLTAPTNPTTILEKPAKGITEQHKFTNSLWNSTTGRLVFFCTTLVFFAMTSMGLVISQIPALDEDLRILLSVLTFVSCSAYYSLPYFAERAGMGLVDANWKPHLYLYRISFFFGFPAFLLISLGFGGEASAGNLYSNLTWNEANQQAIGGNLNNNVGDAISLQDGFVGLNLTKAIIKTMSVAKPMNPGQRLQTRVDQTFLKDTLYAEIPYFDDPDPLADPPKALPLDVLQSYAIAPIFRKWTRCTTRFKVAQICMDENPIIGFAYVKNDQWCRRARSIACKTQKPIIEPYYHCRDKDRIKNGRTYMTSIMGICGRVAPKPHPTLFEEIIQKHVKDGWEQGKNMEYNNTLVWLDVAYDDYIANHSQWTETWSSRKTAAIIFGTFVILLILISFGMDYYVDRYLYLVPDKVT